MTQEELTSSLSASAASRLSAQDAAPLDMSREHVARQPLPPQELKELKELKELNSSYSLAEDLKQDLCREKQRLCGEELKEHLCGEELKSTVRLAEALSLAGRHRHV